MRIDIRSDIKAASIGLFALPEKITAPATARALNRTITSLRAQAAREMRKDYGNLPIRILKALMRFARANKYQLQAKLTFSNKRIPLLRWNAIQTATGVKVKGPKRIETWEGEVVPPEALRHAFIATSANGVRSVFLRVGKKRYPITGVVAASLARSYVEGRINALLTDSARTKFFINYQRELKFALGQ
jgi:hypothetical protein